MESLLSQFIKTALRNLAAPLILWLAAKGYLSEDQSVALVIAVATAVAAFVWGFGNKLYQRYVIGEALALPAGSTTDDLKDVIAGAETIEEGE